MQLGPVEASSLQAVKTPNHSVNADARDVSALAKAIGARRLPGTLALASGGKMSVRVWGMALCGLVVLAEFRLSSSWSPAYFRRGLPVFVHRVRVPRPLDRLPTPESLAPLLRDDLLSTAFKALSPTELAFREGPRLGCTAYSAIMHGLIRLEATGDAVTIRGLLNWFPVVMLGLFSVLLSELGVLVTVAIDGFLVAFGVAVYLFQAQHFRAVGAAVVGQV